MVVRTTLRNMRISNVHARHHPAGQVLWQMHPHDLQDAYFMPWAASQLEVPPLSLIGGSLTALQCFQPQMT